MLESRGSTHASLGQKTRDIRALATINLLHNESVSRQKTWYDRVIGQGAYTQVKKNLFKSFELRKSNDV